MADGIHIPREVADAEGVPEDLDAGVVGPYRFPDPSRRMISAWIYLGLAVALGISTTMIPGLWVVAGLAAVLAAWHALSAWQLELEQEQALERAATAVPFAVGHASAALTFQGWRSRPRWHVVLYSADEPPSERGLVELDAVSGAQTAAVYVEPVPEQL